MKNTAIMALILAAGIGLGIFTSTSLPLATVEAKPSPFHVEKYTISGKLAFAQWFSENDEVYTQGYVNLVDIAKDSSGNVVSFVDVAISQYKLEEHCKIVDGQEICNYDYQPLLGFFGTAELDKSDFTISNSLRSASLKNVQVTGDDYYSGKQMTIIVDGTWTDAGGPIKVRDTHSESTDYYKVFFRGMAKGTEADASIQITGDINLSNTDDNAYSESFILKAKNSVFYRISEEPI